EKAFDSLEKILHIDTKNGEALFYAGICLKRFDKLDEAESRFAKCRENNRFAKIATIKLAELSIIRGDYIQAAGRVANLANSPTPYSAALLALAYRKTAKSAERQAALNAAKRALRFEPLVIGEEYFAGETSDFSELRPQILLELLTRYMNLNLFDEALELIEAHSRLGNKTIPLISYYKAYLTNRIDTEDINGEWDFASRTESESVLKFAVNVKQNDSTALYHLGNLLASKRRWSEALDCWMKVEGEFKSLASRNIGLFHWKISEEISEALKNYQIAAGNNNVDPKTLWEFDKLLEGIPDSTTMRMELYKNNKHRFQSDNRLMIRRASALLAAGKPEETLEILRNNTFHLCEGKMYSRSIHINACLQISEKFARQKDYQIALSYAEQALDYPENLGVGKPAANLDSEIFVRCGELCEKTGNTAKAAEYFQKAAEPGGGIDIDFFPLRELEWRHDPPAPMSDGIVK
ncbi:MAG: hypothetical protein KAG97_07265, partial [Victivallales bacterium]|nr:hypothetical protein [Victivallales bacterium]